MKTQITSSTTGFIALIPPLAILLITATGNPDLFKKKQQSKNQKIIPLSSIQKKI